MHSVALASRRLFVSLAPGIAESYSRNPHLPIRVTGVLPDKRFIIVRALILTLAKGAFKTYHGPEHSSLRCQNWTLGLKGGH